MEATDPLIVFGLSALGVTVVALILSIVLGFVRMRDWLRERRERRRRDAQSEKVRLRTEEARRQREIDNAHATAIQANALLVESMIELALAQQRIAELELLVARKERMRRIYFIRIQQAKEAGFSWPSTRSPRRARTARSGPRRR